MFGVWMMLILCRLLDDSLVNGKRGMLVMLLMMMMMLLCLRLLNLFLRTFTSSYDYSLSSRTSMWNELRLDCDSHFRYRQCFRHFCLINFYLFSPLCNNMISISTCYKGKILQFFPSFFFGKI